MSHGALSERIRERAIDKYIRPALRDGRRRFSIEVKDLMRELEAEGFPPNHPAQFCSAVQKHSFLLEHGLQIEKVDGPPSKKSTTVVVHYRVAGKRDRTPAANREPQAIETTNEDPAARAKRLSERLRGLLKKELSEYGGAEGFMRWVRSEGEDAA